MRSTPGIAALTSNVTRLMAAPTKAVQRTGLSTMARLLIDTAKRQLAPIPHPAVKTRDTYGGWGVLCQGHLNEAVAIEDPREAIMGAADDRMDLTKGREKATNNNVGHFGGAVPEVYQTGFGFNPDHTRGHATIGDATGDRSVTVSCRLVGKLDSAIPQELNSG